MQKQVALPLESRFRTISISYFAENKKFKYHFFKVKIEPEVLKKKAKIKVLKGSSKIRTPSD